MGGGGKGSGMMTTDHQLIPLVSNEVVTITIIDSDGMGGLAYVYLLLSFLKERNTPGSLCFITLVMYRACYQNQ